MELQPVGENYNLYLTLTEYDAARAILRAAGTAHQHQESYGMAPQPPSTEFHALHARLYDEYAPLRVSEDELDTLQKAFVVTQSANVARDAIDGFDVRAGFFGQNFQAHWPKSNESGLKQN